MLTEHGGLPSNLTRIGYGSMESSQVWALTLVEGHNVYQYKQLNIIIVKQIED